MMPWLIDFQDEKVVIVGGGKVAFRKAEQFLKHQAQVIVIARDFIDDFQLLDCQQIQDQYSCHYLNEAFFVYSATNDKEVNQQIINDAKRMHIMCASATASNAQFMGMSEIQTENMTLGISTNGTYPAFSKKLKTDLLKYDEYIGVLAKIRSEVLQKEIVSSKYRQRFFNQLMLFEKEELELIWDFIKQGKGLVLIFHRLLDETAYAFAKSCQGYPIAFSDHQFQLKIETLQMIEIELIIQPMVIAYGKIYDRIQASLSIQCQEPLFVDKYVLEDIYSPLKKRLFLIHPRQTRELYDLLSSYGDVYTFNDTEYFDYDYDIIIPFLLRKGFHYQKDILRIRDMMSGKYHEFRSVLLEDDQVKDKLIQKIKSL